MKASRYNFWAATGDGTHLLYNGVTGAMVEVDASEHAEVIAYLAQPDDNVMVDDDAVATLVGGGFVVPHDCDEAATLVQRSQNECRSHDLLELTIVPTYACNFRCVYCYIDFKGLRMSPDVELRTIRFLHRSVPAYRQTQLTWFGGEPLLCLDTVLRVSEVLNEIGTDHDQPVQIFLPTNGYLLTPETAARLFAAGVAYFHVTIDGTSLHHDTRRVLANGGPTFERIHANLLGILEAVPRAHLTLRMNLDADSVDSAIDLLSTLPSQHRHRVQVHPTPILHTGIATSLPFYRSVDMVTSAALREGFAYHDAHIGTWGVTHCDADKDGNLQIGPTGDLCKCNPTSKPEAHVGRLDESGTPIWNDNYKTWLDAPALGPGCMTCPYLCFCNGGCRVGRIRGESDSSCRDRFADMDQLIRNRYHVLLSREGGARRAASQDSLRSRRSEHTGAPPLLN